MILLFFWETRAQLIRKLDEMKISSSFFRIVPTSQVIEMGDHPAKAFSQKRNSSIAVGYRDA